MRFAKRKLRWYLKHRFAYFHYFFSVSFKYIVRSIHNCNAKKKNLEQERPPSGINALSWSFFFSFYLLFTEDETSI